MRKRKKAVRKGFTMVELMAVLIILGLLAAVVVRNFVGQTDRARVTTTNMSLKLLHNAVSEFKMNTGRFPEDEGLTVLIVPPDDVDRWEPYLQTTELPKDAWGNDFIYERYPESGKPFVIKSFGPDGEEGTEDDLLSTDAY